jgi:DNA-binding MarR family transcriptional regulator
MLDLHEAEDLSQEAAPSGGTADLEQALVTKMDSTISRYQRTIRRAIELAEGPSRLTMPQLRCLQRIARGDSLTTHLARTMGVAVPTMTSMIDGLSERGLVERQPDPTDRRQVRILLTPAGNEVLARYQTIMHDRLHDLLQHLTVTQKKRLLAAMDDMAAMLDADKRRREEREKSKGNG